MPRLRFLIAPLSLLGVISTAEGQISPCLPSDSGATNLVQFVTYLISSSDSGVRTLRANLGLNNVNVSQVSVITSGTTCTQARQALNSLANTPTSRRRM
jgi:hypothetical protein